MRRSPLVVATLVALTVLTVVAQDPLSPEVDLELSAMLKEVPTRAEIIAAGRAAPLAPRVPLALPRPSLTDPFGIGEALYDPGRMSDAVVSLLELVGVVTVPDAVPGAAPPAGASGLILSQSEVRALIELGMEDLESSGGMENLPHSLADLHAAIADLAPGLTVEQLAAGYSRAYQSSPDDVLPKVLMGQPIEPDMKLTRTQIWFLLMDGFGGVAGSSVGGARWGTADRVLPDLPSPNPQWSAVEWREVMARLPIIPTSRLVAATAPASIAKGATANPAPVNIMVRANPAAEPLVSRLTGRTLIAARAGSLAGEQVMWRLRRESSLQEIGKVVTPVDELSTIGADGTARFVIQPVTDPTGGSGQQVEDRECVEARLEARGLVEGAYAVPSAAARLPIGEREVCADVRVSWKSGDTLTLFIANKYTKVNFEIPGIGGGRRDGEDWLMAVVTKRQSGNYFGWGVAMVEVRSQTLRGGSKCQSTANLRVGQTVFVQISPREAPSGNAGPGSGFGPLKALGRFYWLAPRRSSMTLEPPDGGYGAVEIYPATEPDRPNDVCLPHVPADPEGRQLAASAKYFIPFNDAQWTTPGQGYGIGLRAKGETAYADLSSVDPLSEVDPIRGDTRLQSVKSLFQLTGSSLWAVRITR